MEAEFYQGKTYCLFDVAAAYEYVPRIEMHDDRPQDQHLSAGSEPAEEQKPKQVTETK